MRRTCGVLGWFGCGLLIAQAQIPLPRVQARTQFELGWSSWGLHGSAAKFRQYATPPRGFFLRMLRYEQPAMHLWWQGGGDQDTRGDALVPLLTGQLTLQAHHARSQFTDPVGTTSPESERRHDELSLRYLLTPDFALTLHLRGDTLRRPFATDHLPYHQTVRAWDLTAEGVLGAGRLSLQYTRWHYRDRTDIRPNLTVQRWQSGYLWELTPALDIEAIWSETQLEQSERPRNRMQHLTLFTDWTPSISSEVGLMLQRERLNLPVVRNSWTRERRTGILSLVQQFGGWRLQMGIRRQSLERLDHEQEHLEPIQREGIEARLWGRLNRQTRLTLYGMSQRWSRQASGEAHNTLFWSRREVVRLNLDSTFPQGFLYLTLARQRWLNDPRATRLRSDQLLVGGTCQLAAGLTLNAEHHDERWQASGGADGLIGLPRFLPDTRTSQVGLQWTPNTRLSVSMHLTHLVSSVDNPLLLPDGNVEGRFLTLSVRYQIPSGAAWSLTFAPWRYHDRVDSRVDYRLSLFALSWSTPF